MTKLKCQIKSKAPIAKIKILSFVIDLALGFWHLDFSGGNRA
jgi:hypothetical protein